MATDERFDESVSRWLEDAAPARLPERVLEATFERTRRSRQHAGWRALLGRMTMPRFVPALGSAVVVVVAAALVLSFYVNRQGGIGASPSATPIVTATPPLVDLGIFELVAGWIVYGNQTGIWAVDPASPRPATTVQLASEAGIPLGWSSDGTRLLIMGDENLFVLDADGTETQVTGRPMPKGSAILSPDGSRVVFAAENALYAVDADGGPTEMLLLQTHDYGFEELAFSPDGTRIAYAEGAGDHSHSVWLMDADGTDAHQIVLNDIDRAGHVYGLAWSPAGDRIALGFEGFIYTFATDGSDFTQIAGADTTCESAQSCAVQIPSGATSPYWSPDGSQIAYTTGCVDGAGAASKDGCILAIADADGSNVREFSYGMSGPWHPGTPSPSLEPAQTPTVESTEAPPPETPQVNALLNAFLEARVAGEGAEEYLLPVSGDSTSLPPLLYATTSGAPYERAEFEPVLGIEWPYGWTAFKVRLFAGDTVVEQLFFWAGDDPLKLKYNERGFATDIAPTTEDGQPVAVPYDYFNGEVTLQGAHPWVSHSATKPPSSNTLLNLIPEGPDVVPTTDGWQRGDWDELFLIADPALLGTNCQPVPDPADAAALAESIRSDPGLEATAPVAVSVGGADAVVMDVKIAAEATICVPANTETGDVLPNAVLLPVLKTYETLLTFVDERAIRGHATGEWMRLYLFDVPEGSSMRILAIAIVAPESRFESVVEAAAPIVDSIEFHAP